MADTGITFASVIDILAEVFGDSITSRNMALARFKGWQHTGLIQGTGTGRGRKASYTKDIAWTAILLAELQRIGFPRENAAAFVAEHRSFLDAAIDARLAAHINCRGGRGTGISIDLPALIAIFEAKGVPNG